MDTPDGQVQMGLGSAALWGKLDPSMRAALAGPATGREGKREDRGTPTDDDGPKRQVPT